MNGETQDAPLWEQALRVWWLITWRSIALLLLVNATLFLVLSLFGGTGPGMHGARGMAGNPAVIVLVWLIYIGVGVWVVRMALAKRYRGFRIRLVPTGTHDGGGDASF
jgi:hypothetical protein